MGDVVSLVERAAETIQAEDAEAMAKKMAKGQFYLDDLRTQLNQMRRMSCIGALAGMIPGLKKAQAAMAQSGRDDKMLIHFDAIMGSMTPKEPAAPAIIHATRTIRIANGSGTSVKQVNKLDRNATRMNSR